MITDTCTHLENTIAGVPGTMLGRRIKQAVILLQGKQVNRAASTAVVSMNQD